MTTEITVDVFCDEFGENNVVDNGDGTVTIRRVFDGGVKSFATFEVSDKGFVAANKNENYD
jgi:hypothetical protein